MNKPIFITPAEIDTTDFGKFLADCMNMRFKGFLNSLAKELGVPAPELMAKASEILEKADIPQDAPEPVRHAVMRHD